MPFHFHVTPDDSVAEEIAGAAGLAVSALGDAASLVKLVRLIRETKEATLPILLCAACAARWRAARRARVLAWLPGFGALLAFLGLALTRRGPMVSEGVTANVIFVAAFSAAAYVLLSLVPKLIDKRVAEPATAGAVAITPEWVALTRVHPRAVAELMTVEAPAELRALTR